MRPASDVRRRLPLLRRTLALLLALLPVGGSAATVAAAIAAPAGPAACTDHVCSCHKKCPPKKAAHRPGCHGAESEAPSGPFFQNAGCHHGDDSIGPVATTPHLAAPAIEVDPGFQATDHASLVSAHPLAGHPHLHGKPPKARG
jgi:hypothetical protein